MSDLPRVKSLQILQESLNSIRNLSTGSLDRLNEPPAPEERVRTTSLSSVLQGWSVGADDDDDDDDSSDDDAGRSLFEPKLPGARPDMCVASPDPAPCREVTPDDSSGRRVDAPPTRLGPRMPQPPTPSPRVGLAPSLPVVAAPSSGTKRPASPPERPSESGALATSLPQPTADSAARRPPRFRRDLEVVIPAHLLPASKRARGLSNSGSD
mmetsp:Transcript_22800/g.70518  ORF Transcript_22800/g.70518 Transcript_22800/m.70518 type:complete len:211 (-) Transcript_22800:25-657(-)